MITVAHPIVLKQLSFLLALVIISGSGVVHAADEALVDAEEPQVKVNFSGAPEELADNLKAHLPSLRRIKCDSDRERVERFIAASGDKLNEGAEAMGYFSARFKSDVVRQGGCWVLNIVVEPGQTVRVRNINILLSGQGKGLEPFKEVISTPPYKQGDVLVSSSYEDFKSSLSSRASQLGFFDATFVKRQIAVNIEALTADVDLQFETGKRYQIGEVKIEQDVLNDSSFERYVRLEQGQVYDSNDLLAQRRLLDASGYYKDVQITNHFMDAKGEEVPVSIKAIRNKRYSYDGKVGYSTAGDGFSDEKLGMTLELGMDT
ncbi:MAG: Unknown protein, partial [uncultured Thiotrichaceae bacterium]